MAHHRAYAFLHCSCCGALIENSAAENTSHGEVPYPHDTGYGMCRSCGGDPSVTGDDEESVKKRYGTAACMFYDSRIAILSEALTGDDRKRRFDSFDYELKVAFVNSLIEKGHMT